MRKSLTQQDAPHTGICFYMYLELILGEVGVVYNGINLTQQTG